MELACGPRWIPGLEVRPGRSGPFQLPPRPTRLSAAPAAEAGAGTPPGDGRRRGRSALPARPFLSTLLVLGIIRDKQIVPGSRR